MRYYSTSSITALRVFITFLCATILLLAGCSKYSDEEHEKNVLNGMLVNEEYRALEKAFSKAEQQYRRKKITALQWEGRWYSLADINADGIAPRFDSWVAQAGSGYAHLARGMYLQVQAWEARGNKIAEKTSDAQFAEFKRLSEKAEDDLIAAGQKLPGCALCAAERIRVNRALGRPLRESEPLLDEALSSDPQMRSAVLNYFAGLYPQWGGSFELMRTFIDEMQSRGQDPTIIAQLESRFCWEQARAAESRKDENAAFEWYQRGVTAHPYDMLMKHLAESYSERGQYQKAAEILEQNLRVNNPWDLYTTEALAQAYFQSGQQDKGKAMMRKRDEGQQRYNSFQ